MKNFFTNQALIEIYTFFNNNKNQKIIKINVINPDLCLNNYAGERIIIDEKEYICRSYKSWNDLAEKFYFRMMTPKIVDELFIELSFIKLEENSFHSIKEVEEKYGVTSEFSRINKNEEPEFLFIFTSFKKY